jgi:hypothetical protein
VSETPVETMAKKVDATPGNQTGKPVPNTSAADTHHIALTEPISLKNSHKIQAPIKRKPTSLSPTLLGITSTTDNLVPKIAKRNTVIAFNEDDEKYMAYSREDGNAVKLPKKMFDALTCPTKDVGCLQRIKQLQEKIAASALFADFTGVLDILNNLGENQ